MKNLENKLIDGFKSVELEERLEMVHLSVLSEGGFVSLCTDSGTAAAATK